MMMMNPNPLPAVPATIQSTAGAVPVKNDKGRPTFQLSLYINRKIHVMSSISIMVKITLFIICQITFLN